MIQEFEDRKLLFTTKSLAAACRYEIMTRLFEWMGFLANPYNP